MMALAALALFAGEGAGQAGRIGLLALLFFLVSLPCLASWALLGVGSAVAALAVADETLQPGHGAVVAGIGLGRPAALRRSGSFLTNLWAGTPGPGWLWWDDP